jgi:hypothetical protein
MSSSSSSAVAFSEQSSTRYINPVTCIIHNLPVTRNAAGRGSSKSLVPLRDILIENGYSNVSKVHKAWTSSGGFHGYAVIEFRGNGLDDFRQAKQLAARYASRGRGKDDFNDHDADCYVHAGPYLWVATDEDVSLLQRVYRRFGFWTVPKSVEEEDVPYFDHEVDPDVVQLIYNQLYPRYPPINVTSDPRWDVSYF